LFANKDTVTNVAEAFPNKKRQDGRFYAIDLTFDEIKSLKVSERFDHKNPSKPIYSSRFPLNQASFRLNSLEEEIQLVQGLTKSLNTIYELDKTSLLTAKKRFNTGIYVELKDPKFHKESGKKNFAEIVFKILDKYNYKNKNDNIIIQCFDADELRRIRQELKSNLTLVQLLYPENLDSYFTFWNSKEGLDQIAKFADGIGPEISQLITWNETNKNTIKESEFYKNAKKLGLFMHPYTFRIDSLPPYVSNFVELLDLYINKLKVDGLFTDFPDLAIKYIESSGNNLKFNNLFFLFNLLFVFSKLFLKF
jgi:glycerophosphoryl diester phosphodiesterase